ncbi:heme-binding Shp domain-containing protein [Amedibacillus sp. YH-ame10]
MSFIKKISFLCVAAFLVCMQYEPITATSDGAYVITCSSSYVNPLTGATEDGGSNIELGNSMVSSIVESHALVEQTQGALYVTVGLGLASNVSNVRFQLMNSDGTRSSVSGVITGSSQANGDTVNHYRIQVSALTQYISPIIYVGPMGRDVQFFIQMNPNTLTAGTGIYNSHMITSTTPSPTENTQPSTATKEETKEESKEEIADKNVDTEEKNRETTKKNTQTSSTVTKQSLFKDVKGLSSHPIQEERSNIWLYTSIGVLFVLIIAGGSFYYVKKIKK